MAAEAPAKASNADASSSLQVSEVVVTAQRSEQNLQSVPISVTAVQSATMHAMQIVSTKDLDQVVPGLVMNRKANAVQPFVRGIGTATSAAGVEAPVATYVDGVYIPTPYGATFDLPDVERVEVLKGPQGTLFGRNATSGALNVVTRAPSETPGFEGEVGYANYDTLEAKAYVTGPLGDAVRANLSFYLNDQRDGWGEVKTSPLAGKDFRKGRVIATRGKAVWTPMEGTSLELGAFYMQNRGDITGFSASPGVLHRVGTQTFINPGIYDSTQTTPFQGFNIKHYGGNLKADGHVGDWELINTAAVQKVEATTYTPIFGGTPFAADPVITGIITDETFSDEFRVQYSSSAGHRLVAGVYYLDERLRFGQFNFNTTPPPYTGGAVDDVTTKSKAVFADGTYAVGGGFSLTGGIRYTDDSRTVTKIQIYRAATGTFSDFPARQLKTNKVTYRIVGQWQASDDVMAYVSQSTGYKAGFFSLGGATPTAPPLLPELLTAREIGVKSELFNRRVRLNVAAFTNSYSNIVVQQTVTINGLTNALQTNAARARTRGVEADIYARVTEGLTLSGGLSYMPTARFTSYKNANISVYNPTTGAITTFVGDATGNRLIQAPKLEAQAQALYKMDTDYGVVNLALNVAHRSRIYLIPDNRLSQSAITLVNASAQLTLPDNHYSIAIWGKNLGGEDYITDAVQSGGVDIIVPGSPRTYGVTLKAVF